MPFLAAKKGLPAGVDGVAGSATTSAALARRIRDNPRNWYANLHTAQFPGGAIRGQLYPGDW
ncbi:CHRD domain-containing protein [Nonomuraea sp. KM88]|uniref:CHRD domain-containing protein n=1 Tax=Nonomuraea sp. KM88 TaxID=3457427 RepID=UPI003FCE25D7